MEPRHASSVLAVTGFEFENSPVGAYREIALSVLVAPRLAPGVPMPRAALYPFRVGTTTRASRRHGQEQWRLPHLDDELEIEIQRDPDAICLLARASGRDILRLTVTDDSGAPWETVEHSYQTFARDATGAYVSALTMEGTFMEHEEERGDLRLHPHDFTASLDLGTVAAIPFREQWMKNGLESIFPLQPLAALAGR